MNNTNATTLPPTGCPEPVIAVQLVSGSARLVGIILMCVNLCLAVSLAIWTAVKRNSPVVKAMQPGFLLLICLGNFIYTFTIMPVGANDVNTKNIDAMCMSIPWLRHMGQTITYSALFSKLWRINQIFHAKGFQRKVVTAKDVLWPLMIILSINLTLLTVMSIVDPYLWSRNQLRDGNPGTSAGQCQYSSHVGGTIDRVLEIGNLLILATLCIQAYRARDIGTEFSEARGVALALFCTLQSSLIVIVPLALMDTVNNADAWYFLVVMPIFFNGLSMNLFIFFPIIAHHRQKKQGDKRRDTKTHVTGLDPGVAAADRVSGPILVNNNNEHQEVEHLATEHQEDEPA